MATKDKANLENTKEEKTKAESTKAEEKEEKKAAEPVKAEKETAKAKTEKADETEKAADKKADKKVDAKEEKASSKDKKADKGKKADEEDKKKKKDPLVHQVKGTEYNVYSMAGKKVDTIDLAEAVFGLKPNERAMHAAVVNFLANQRQGTQSTKTRGEVRGGGRKPWRQKGTGHARQGSTRSPQWTHGGVALGPKPRDYSYRINRKVKRLALLSALSAKCAAGEIVVVDKLGVADYKTRPIIEMLQTLEVGKKVLIVSEDVNPKLVKSAANIPGVKTTTATLINVYDLLNADTFVVCVDAVKKIEEVFGQ